MIRRLKFLERPGWTVAVGSGILVVVYLSDINRNLLYLSMLMSIFALFAFLWRRGWTAALACLALAYFAAVSAGVPSVKFIDPLPLDPKSGLPVTALPADQIWKYRFVLTDLGQHQALHPMTGYLHIDGRNLANLEVKFQDRILRAADFSHEKYYLMQASIPLTPAAAGEIEVVLQSKALPAPEIYFGPESRRRDSYPDAVWLEFVNGPDVVLYHAARSILPLPSR